MNRRAAAPGRALFESLEQRVKCAAAAAPFSANINFSPSPAPPARGYRLDYGATFARRGGLEYGWATDHRSDARYKPSPQYNNARVNSYIGLKAGDTWEIAVPNGYYRVHALMGKPGLIAGDYQLNVEGKLFLNGKPYRGYAFIEGYITIAVADGRLTLTAPGTAIQDRLCSVEIAQVAAPVAPPPGNTINWSSARLNAPVARVEASIVRLGDDIYTIGGFTDSYTSTTNRFDVMNVRTLHFKTLATFPGAQTHTAAATDGTYIYVAGGQFGPELSSRLTAQIWRYDIRKNSWSSFGRLPAIHIAGQLVYLDGKLHYLGGDDATRVRAQTTHWVFDLAKPGAGWTTAAPMPSAADHGAAFALHGAIYFVGGDTDHGTSYLSQSGLFAYDPARDKWATFAALPEGTSHIEAGALTDGKNIIVMAGQIDAQKLTSHVYTYSIRKNVWYKDTNMPTARKSGVAWLHSGRLFYLSGDDATYGLQPWAYEGTIVS